MIVAITMPINRNDLRRIYRLAVTKRIRQIEAEIAALPIEDQGRKALRRELRELHKMNKWVLE
jgi:hypothetical protein